MVASEIREQFHEHFVRIIIFTSIPFDYHIMDDKLSLQSWAFDLFTGVYRIDRELQALKSLELKFWLRIIVFRIFLDVLFRVFTFFKASFNALTSLIITF